MTKKPSELINEILWVYKQSEGVDSGSRAELAYLCQSIMDYLDETASQPCEHEWKEYGTFMNVKPNGTKVSVTIKECSKCHLLQA